MNNKKLKRFIRKDVFYYGGDYARINGTWYTISNDLEYIIKINDEEQITSLELDFRKSMIREEDSKGSFISPDGVFLLSIASVVFMTFVTLFIGIITFWLFIGGVYVIHKTSIFFINVFPFLTIEPSNVTFIVVVLFILVPAVMYFAIYSGIYKMKGK